MGITLASISASIASAINSVGAVIGVSFGATAAGVQSTIIATSISIGLSSISSFLLKPSLGSQDQKQNIRQPTAARRRYYGQVKIGGVWAFLKAAEPKLYQVIMLCEGGQTGIDSFVEHYLGDDVVTLSGNDVVIPERYVQHSTKYAQIYPQLGTSTQTAHGTLVSAFPSDWTSDHKLLGIAEVLIVLLSPPANRFTEVYDAGLPQYNAVIRASKVWDPRDEAQDPDDPSTWAYV